MTWLLLAGTAALCYALQGAWTKRLTRRVSREAATWAIFAFAFPLLAGYLALDGLPEVRPRFWLVLAVNVVLYVVSFRLYVSALDVGELGITYPLLALTPVVVVPVEWALLGDRVGPWGMAGIALVAGGVYLLNLEGGRDSLLAPFRALARRPGARLMLGVALLWSVSGTLDRAAVLSASPALYGTVVSLVVGLALAPAARGEIARAFGAGDGTAAPGGPPGGGDPSPGRAAADDDAGDGGPRWALVGALAVQGLLFAAMFVTQMEALRLSLAANVLTVKRSGTILTVLLGGLLFREESTGRRLAGTLVVLVGVYLVATS